MKRHEQLYSTFIFFAVLLVGTVVLSSACPGEPERDRARDTIAIGEVRS